MTANRVRLADALARVADANAAFRKQLEFNAELLQRAMDRLQEGGPFADTLESMPVQSSISATSSAETALFDARQAVRRALVWVAIDEGMSVERLAVIFEVSVDVISSYAVANPSPLTQAL